MTPQVTIIAIVLPLIIILMILFSIAGIKLCNENNTYGVLLLFIALNIFGLILGCCIISNLRYKEKKTLYDKLDKFLDKQENNISQQSN